MNLGKEVVFQKLGGLNVPLQPWPQSFYVSAVHLYGKDEYELRPLTITGLVKGVGKNFICMNFWRLQFLLWRGGFLCTKIGHKPSWRDFRWDFRNTLRVREEVENTTRIMGLLAPYAVSDGNTVVLYCIPLSNDSTSYYTTHEDMEPEDGRLTILQVRNMFISRVFYWGEVYSNRYGWFDNVDFIPCRNSKNLNENMRALIVLLEGIREIFPSWREWWANRESASRKKPQ